MRFTIWKARLYNVLSDDRDVGRVRFCLLVHEGRSGGDLRYAGVVRIVFYCFIGFTHYLG